MEYHLSRDHIKVIILSCGSLRTENSRELRKILFHSAVDEIYLSR